MKTSKCIILLMIIFLGAGLLEAPAQQPVRIAVAGISHGHVPWILGREKKPDIELAGIYEADTALARKYAAAYKLPLSLFYSNLTEMLTRVKPEGVVAFGSIFDHKVVVEAAAPLGIHVMMEKPLAVNAEHAERMKVLAEKHRIHILTNFETSWYPSIHKTHQLISDSAVIGTFNRLVVHMGHQGPKEIGVSPEFFAWLTDPVQNGGGALTDFGCYGANIMTWLMNGEEPVSVTAVTKQYKPSIYPKVDDDATIIISYANAECIIQASWNWPFSRKDIAAYGTKGYLITEDARRMRMRIDERSQEQSFVAEQELAEKHADPFRYFAGVIRGRIEVPEYGLYSLKNNVLSVRILDAARRSATTGKTIYFR